MNSSFVTISTITNKQLNILLCCFHGIHNHMTEHTSVHSYLHYMKAVNLYCVGIQNLHIYFPCVKHMTEIKQNPVASLSRKYPICVMSTSISLLPHSAASQNSLLVTRSILINQQIENGSQNSSVV
jgi:hypothetical protein